MMDNKYVRLAVVAGLMMVATGAVADEAAENEHLKVEGGFVFEKYGGGEWTKVGDARLGEGVKALQDIYQDVTIAIDPKLRGVELADLKVRSDNVKEDLEALRATTGNQFDIETPQNPNDGGDPKLFTLEPNTLFVRAHEDAGGKDVQVFSVEGYLDSRTKEKPADQAVKELENVIFETVGDMDGSIKAPTIRFHEDAKLLVVIGTPAALEVAGKVINALPGQQGMAFHYDYAPGARSFSRGGGFGGSYSYSVGGGSSSQVNQAPVANPAVPATPAAAAAK